MGFIDSGRREGAQLLCGGDRPSDPQLRGGNFLRPTVFDNVRQDMRIARPAACHIGAGDADPERRLCHQRALGSCSTRSAVISRWISLVPPEIEKIQLHR